MLITGKNGLIMRQQTYQGSAGFVDEDLISLRARHQK